MSGGSQYVVAAYAVIWFVVMLYVVVIGMRTARLARETELIGRLVADREDARVHSDEAAGVGP